MKNKFEIRGDITAIFLNSPKYGSMEALISTSKLGKAMEFPKTWYPHWNPDTQSFYCLGAIKNSEGKRGTASMHRWITNCPKEKQVDHRNSKTLDNTDINLRFATSAENSQNRKGSNRDSLSGVRGVCWSDRIRKWRAQVHLNGKQKYIGSFGSIQEAGQAVSKVRSIIMPFSKDAS